MRHDEGRLTDVANHIGHGEGFARAGDPKESLVLVTGLNGFGELGDSLGLISGWLVVAVQFKGHLGGNFDL